MTTEKAPVKKKAPKVKEIKKPLIIGGIFTVVAIAGIIVGIVILGDIDEKGGTVIIGIELNRKVEEIEPLIVWWTGKLVPTQVAETLFDNDFSSAESKFINTLVINYTWNDDENATELTVSLREGVDFHDGTPFNAEAVKWNFDRMYHLINVSLDPYTTWSWNYLFKLPDGRWIVNETQVVNEYTVKFVLNDPFVPFLQFLTHHSTSILSPTSTPFDEILNFLTDDIVGTGPFIYDGYILNSEVRMSSNPNYWGGKPKIDSLILRYYDTVDDLWDAFLVQNVTILAPLQTNVFWNKSLEMLKNDPKFTVQENPGTNYQYVGMNTININVTMRKAISYSINYSTMIEELWPFNKKRVRSPIPEGIKYSNTTAFDLAYYNISIARQTLLDANWPGTDGLTANNNVSVGNEWERLVYDENPLETYNLSSFTWSYLYVAPKVRENLKQIGIKVDLTGNEYWANQLFVVGWFYDYNDPHNALYEEYSSKSSQNMDHGAHLNDSLVDQWIEEAAKETDPVLRKHLYYKIQERLIEELYPYAWTYSTNTIDIYASNLKGWRHNPLKLSFKTVYFV